MILQGLALEKALPHLSPEIENRARRILGLEEMEREPCALPARVEHLWRAENFNRIVPYIGSFLLPLGHAPDMAALADSVDAVIARHQALHSRLAVTGGRAILVPDQRQAVSLQPARVSRSEIGAHRENRPGSPVTEFFSAPIDLFEQRGFRAHAFEDEEGNVTLGILMHHYFGDAWSSQIFRSEIGTLYKSRVTNAAAELAPVTQYSDYALFQRRLLQKNLAGHLDYWHQRLHAAPASGLPFDQREDENNLGRAYFLIGKDAMASLAAVARAERISLGVICFAAFQLALARWCGVTEIVSAVQCADRIRPQFRGTIGYLLSAIAIHSTLDKDMPFNEFLRAFAKDVYNGIAHQELSFELYDDIFAPPQPFCTPRFNFTPHQESFFIGDNETTTPAITGIVQAPDIRKISAYRDLQFLVVEYPEGLVGRAVYNKALSFGNIASLIEIYQSVLSVIASGGNVRLGEFTDTCRKKVS